VFGYLSGAAGCAVGVLLVFLRVRQTDIDRQVVLRVRINGVGEDDVDR
jgi:hypothetical protein